MSSASLLREPHGSMCVIAHASSLRDFSLFSDLIEILPETFGLVVFCPPDQLSRYRSMDSLVTDQAAELRALIPASTPVVLLGDCMAGHITLNMAQYLTSCNQVVYNIVLLDTIPVEYYLKADIFEILTIPGKAEDFGSLGSTLFELDEQRKATRISLDAWASDAFKAMREQSHLLAEGLQQTLGLPLSETEEMAECLVDWALLAGIVLTSSPISYAGPATLLASPELLDLLPLPKAWKAALPEIEMIDAKIRHFDISMSPMIAESLICT